VSKQPNIEYLKECISYDPETGVCTWLRRPREHFETNQLFNWWNSRYSGKEAGSKRRIRHSEYRHIHLDHHMIAIHRAIWAIVHGEWPNVIDHIDGDGLNNRISNLRNVDSFVNMKNKRRYANCELECGIHKRKGGTYFAGIKVNGEYKHLGSFKTLDEAVDARRAANKLFGFTESHGLPRTSCPG